MSPEPTSRDGGDRRIVLLLSGPNLNLLGRREPDIYGAGTLQDHVDLARRTAESHGLELQHDQSNHEGELVDSIQWACGAASAIVVNAAALTHYAWSIHDALRMFDGPIVELHLSNPYGREPWRHHSVVSPVATGVIAGFGGDGYRMAVEAVVHLLEETP